MYHLLNQGSDDLLKVPLNPGITLRIICLPFLLGVIKVSSGCRTARTAGQAARFPAPCIHCWPARLEVL